MPVVEPGAAPPGRHWHCQSGSLTRRFGAPVRVGDTGVTTDTEGDSEGAPPGGVGSSNLNPSRDGIYPRPLDSRLGTQLKVDSELELKVQVSTPTRDSERLRLRTASGAWHVLAVAEPRARSSSAAATFAQGFELGCDSPGRRARWHTVTDTHTLPKSGPG